MTTKAKRAALYLRVSTDSQTTENQRRVLAEVAEQRGWAIAATYEDAGISGAKGRDKRPAFDMMLKDATRRRFDVLLFWSIDRLGRSTAAAGGKPPSGNTRGRVAGPRDSLRPRQGY